MRAGTCCMRFTPTCRWTSSEEEKRQRFLSPMALSVPRSTGPWWCVSSIGAAIGSLPGNHELDHGGWDSQGSFGRLLALPPNSRSTRRPCATAASHSGRAEPPHKRMKLTRALASPHGTRRRGSACPRLGGHRALAAYPQCWADKSRLSNVSVVVLLSPWRQLPRYTLEHGAGSLEDGGEASSCHLMPFILRTSSVGRSAPMRCPI
jgi:hypothetical protein